MKTRTINLLSASIVFLLILLSGCMGVPKSIPEDLQPEEYFKNAQSAVVDWGNEKAALFYYREFIKRFPDMKGKVIEAEYEIAFIYYKQGNYYESKKRFKEILAKYETEERIYYPEWPKILSEKILKKAEEKSKY
ncbi:MAG: hypothetical protein RBT69_10825 [Spirochaetia bacterium]|jgi:tetratricopeptide (TPR) repeat protein|nr:hypothetical protein [Spirochaetia bacterium]